MGVLVALHSQAPSTQKPAAPVPGGLQNDPLPIPEILKRYQPVSADKLKTPADGDWAMIRRTYDGWGYSPLDQIRPDNVGRLHSVWVFATGVVNGHEAPPIVVNGVMFVAKQWNQVIAIDAKTGTLCGVRRQLTTHVVLLHPIAAASLSSTTGYCGSRGGARCARRSAGEEVCTAQVADTPVATTCLRAVGGRGKVGRTSGGDLAFADLWGYDARTGKKVGETYMVRAREPGSDLAEGGEH